MKAPNRSASSAKAKLTHRGSVGRGAPAPGVGREIWAGSFESQGRHPGRYYEFCGGHQLPSPAEWRAICEGAETWAVENCDAWKSQETARSEASILVYMGPWHETNIPKSLTFAITERTTVEVSNMQVDYDGGLSADEDGPLVDLSVEIPVREIRACLVADIERKARRV